MSLLQKTVIGHARRYVSVRARMLQSDHNQLYVQTRQAETLFCLPLIYLCDRLPENTRLIFIKRTCSFLVLSTNPVYCGYAAAKRLRCLSNTEPLQAQFDDFLM